MSATVAYNTETDVLAERAEQLRKELQAKGYITTWPFNGPAGFDKDTVHRHCVDTKHHNVREWQKVRLSMKGIPTHEKLSILYAWHSKGLDSIYCFSHHVQVYNYLGALRRGGQLDSLNRIRKFQ